MQVSSVSAVSPAKLTGSPAVGTANSSSASSSAAINPLFIAASSPFSSLFDKICIYSTAFCAFCQYGKGREKPRSPPLAYSGRAYRK